LTIVILHFAFCTFPARALYFHIMPRFKDQAVCIRDIDWSETSQVVALFTREHGKVRGLAKGSKRTSPGAIARFSGGIDLLTRGEVVASTKPTTELAAIVEWDLQDPYRVLREDLAAHRLGMYAGDLVNGLTAEHDAHPRIFEALVGFLEGLGERRAIPQALLLRFQWAVLEDGGFRPELEKDVRTGEEMEKAKSQAWMVFDARAGGVRMAEGKSDGSTTMDAGPWRVRRETIELLRRQGADSAAILKDAEEESLKRANKLLCVYTRALIDRELPTMRYVLEDER